MMAPTIVWEGHPPRTPAKQRPGLLESILEAIEQMAEQFNKDLPEWVTGPGVRPISRSWAVRHREYERITKAANEGYTAP